MSRPDVSVVVPVYNPGSSLTRCVESVLSQTLPPDRFEVLLIDDGSTDGTAARLDALASTGRARGPWRRRGPQPHVVVRHEPASGWAGRPRNVGMDLARGRYVQFLDTDDALTPPALALMLAAAEDGEADVVVGKLASDFRALNQVAFRTSVRRATLADAPFAETLTPHKMFRRAFLRDAGIRFAEGPHHVEDELFCLRAYVAARSMAVVAEQVCYRYLDRLDGAPHLGDVPIRPAEYYRDLGAVLDVVDQIRDERVRAVVQRRFLRAEVLGRLRGAAMLAAPAPVRQEMVSHAARAAGRLLPAAAAGTGPLLRGQHELLLAGDVAGLTRLATRLERLRLHATAQVAGWDDGRLVVSVVGRVELDGVELGLDGAPGGWLVRESLLPGVGTGARAVRDSDLGAAEMDLTLSARDDGTVWSTMGLATSVTPDGRLRVAGTVALDPLRRAGGGPVADGVWNVRLRGFVLGVNRSCAVTVAADPPLPTTWLAPGLGTSLTARRVEASGALWLDVGAWSASPQSVLRARTELTGSTVVVRFPALHGPPGSVEVQLRASAPGRAAVWYDATATVAAEGESVVHVDVSALPAGRWTLAWRLGGLGSAPVAELPGQLHVGPTGAVSLDHDGPA